MKRLLVLAFLIAAPATALADTSADAQVVLDAWVKAQNDRDFAAYSALYDKAFLGIRRTSDGSEKKMKLAAWKKDRKKMFKLKSQEVAADNPAINVGKTDVTVTFLQRWRGGSYADHGTKILRLKADKAGALHIVREELLSSTPGWETNPSVELDATALVSPITVRVRAEGIDPGSGCFGVTFVLYLKDKKGTTLQRELGTGDLDVEGVTTVKIEPGADDGLFQFGDWCAGGADYYKIKQSGDSLVVLSQSVGEPTADDIEAGDEIQPTWDTTLTVQLPAGAKIKPKA